MSTKNNIKTINKLEKIVKKIALLTLEISYHAKTGHVGSALSICELVSVLYFSKMNLTKSNIARNDRDRFILSKGHAAAVLYSALYLKGILSKKEFYSFGTDGGLCEHPEIKDKGVEMSTGSLGHGIAFGIGIALGQKKLNKKGKVYVLISDGECAEGEVWEAALLASRLQLNNFTVIIDYNKWQCFGKSQEVSNLEPFTAKWRSFGWEVKTVDGHNINELINTYNSLPFNNKTPSCIIANTISGHGISLIEDKLIGHYKVFSKEEYMIAKKELLKS